VENIFWFSSMENIQLNWEKDEKYGRRLKRLVELLVDDTE
jgi:hypothetical protein